MMAGKRVKRMKVLVVTGSSGGHIFPAVSFLDTLKEKCAGMEALLVLPKRSRKNRIPTGEWAVRYINTRTLTFSLSWKNLISFAKFIQGVFQSLYLLIEFRPDIVIGFGSLDTVPLLVFAWLFRAKTLIHEQNVLPGRANKLLARITDKVAVSFDQTREHFKIDQERVVFTGNPLRRQLERQERKKALEFFGFAEDRFTVLVLGGSQGSQSINSGFPSAIAGISDKSHFQVIHITGVKDYARTVAIYKDLNIEARVFSFLDSMQYAYSLANLIVSRSGATTVTEIIFFKIPAILIPYPHAYEHQLKNAMILEEAGSGMVIRDEELNTGLLSGTLVKFMKNPRILDDMRSSYRGLNVNNASDSLVREAVSLNCN